MPDGKQGYGLPTGRVEQFLVQVLVMIFTSWIRKETTVSSAFSAPTSIAITSHFYLKINFLLFQAEFRNK